MGEEKDEAIAAKVQEGDTESFGVLVDRYEGKLRSYGRRFLAEREDVEDIVQDVFLNVYQNIKSFDTTKRFSPWIYRIAHNAFVNALRKRERAPYSFLDLDTFFSHSTYEDPAESEREAKGIRAGLERGLAKLPVKYREVLVLHYFEEMKYETIADVLQVPLGTVGVRIKRARDALRKVIADMDI